MDIKTEQLNILLQSIKEICRNKNCPDWISKKLIQSVKRAKEFTFEEPKFDDAIFDLNNSNVSNKTYEPDYSIKPFEINEYVISNIENDPCLYQIVKIDDPINNINLYDLKIIKGNKDNPTGLIVHNIPETIINHIKGIV